MKALIIEDENLIAQELIGKIREVADDVEILEVIPSLKVARKRLMSGSEPDVLFMDIQLSDGVSFQLFEEFDLKCPVIFTTAYDEYAIRAFRVNSVDYLLKPIENEDLKRAIDKCRTVLESKQTYPDVIRDLLNTYKEKDEQRKTTFKEKFIVNAHKQWVIINTTDIAAFEKNVAIYIHAFSGERYNLDAESLDEVEGLLDPQKYYRANRQWIVHADAIQSIKQQDNLKLVVSLKSPLKLTVDVSREKAPAFKRWIDR